MQLNRNGRSRVDCLLTIKVAFHRIVGRPSVLFRTGTSRCCMGQLIVQYTYQYYSLVFRKWWLRGLHASLAIIPMTIDEQCRIAIFGYLYMYIAVHPYAHILLVDNLTYFGLQRPRKHGTQQSTSQLASYYSQLVARIRSYRPPNKTLKTG